MPTQRWQKLEPEKQAAILAVARAEFAARGFEAASYNQIIARAGTSKGAMYYYFEDKSDLYATVVRDSVERFLVFVGAPPAIATAADFWAEGERIAAQSFRFYREDPDALGLARSLVRAATEGRSTAPLREVRELLFAYYQALSEVGRSVGAVRGDVPLELLLGVAVSISEAVDFWYAEHADLLRPRELQRLVPRIAGFYRRLAEPRNEDEKP